MTTNWPFNVLLVEDKVYFEKEELKTYFDKCLSDVTKYISENKIHSFTSESVIEYITTMKKTFTDSSESEIGNYFKN